MVMAMKEQQSRSPSTVIPGWNRATASVCCRCSQSRCGGPSYPSKTNHNADAVTRPGGWGAMGMGSQSQLDSEVAYGMVTFNGQGMLTPYSRLAVDRTGSRSGLGHRMEPGRRARQGTLPVTLAVEGVRRDTRRGPADLAMWLRLSMPL